MGLHELELWNRQHEDLLREAENGRLARRLREEQRPRRSFRSGSVRRMAGLGRAIGLWGRISTPFFRA